MRQLVLPRAITSAMTRARKRKKRLPRVAVDRVVMFLFAFDHKPTCHNLFHDLGANRSLYERLRVTPNALNNEGGN